MSIPKTPPKALFFDVFGTVVDWRTSIHRALNKAVSEALHDSQRNLSPTLRDNASSLTGAEWHVFAAEWRQSYKVFTRTYNPATAGPQGFVTIDQHHLDSLRDLLQKWHLEGLLTEEETVQLSLAWHYLDPWPDSTEGLTQLNRKVETSTLSNGNVSLLTDLREYGPLPFKHITSSEEFGAYKPAPVVYDGAARKLGLQPNECGLVAAHLGDLQAAKAREFWTIYVEREQEEDWTDEQVAQAKQGNWVDLWIGLDGDGFREIAKRLGIE